MIDKMKDKMVDRDVRDVDGKMRCEEAHRGSVEDGTREEIDGDDKNTREKMG